MSQETAKVISDLERAIGYIDRYRDPEVYELLAALRRAFEEGDRATMQKTAQRIADHATHRYAAVVEEANRLLRQLG